MKLRQEVGNLIKPVLKRTNARGGCMFSGDVEAVEVFEVTCSLTHDEGNTLNCLITKTMHLSLKTAAVFVTVH